MSTTVLSGTALVLGLYDGVVRVLTYLESNGPRRNALRMLSAHTQRPPKKEEPSVDASTGVQSLVCETLSYLHVRNTHLPSSLSPYLRHQKAIADTAFE